MKRPAYMVYRSNDGWRWRLLATNGRIIADSGEAYTREADVKRAIRAVRLAAAVAKVR